MKRLPTLVLAVVLTISAFGLYHVKYRVQELSEDIARVQTELRQEKEDLWIARAEWVYLNRPERIKKLTEAHLGLHYLHGRQMVNIDEIPMSGQMMAAGATGYASDSYTPAKPVTLKILP